MPARIPARLTYANVTATLALFVVLGVGSAAAADLITGKDVANGSLTGRDIKNKSLSKKDIRGRLQGPAGPAGPPGAPGPPGPPGPSPPGNPIYHAVVDSGGALVRSNLCCGTSSRPLGGAPGQYEVTLPISVQNCVWIPALGEPGSTSQPQGAPGAVPVGEIGVALREGDEKSLFVRTFDSSGAPDHRAFHIAVSCP